MPLVPGMERDSWPGATPPGGGGGVGHSLDGRTPGDAPGRKEDRGSEVTWRKGDARRPRTGDMVENRGTKVRLTGKDAAKGRRCSVRDGSGGSVSASEAAEIAKQARSGATVGARVMLAKVGVNKGRTLPQDVVEHHKAALRFSLRVLGRPVCAGEMVKALVAFGHEPWASLGGKRKKRDGRKKA